MVFDAKIFMLSTNIVTICFSVTDGHRSVIK